MTVRVKLLITGIGGKVWQSPDELQKVALCQTSLDCYVGLKSFSQ